MLQRSLLILAVPLLAMATIFGNVRGIVHDPQHRPVGHARVVVQAQDSAWSQTTQTNDQGEFVFSAVPVGMYSITVRAEQFTASQQFVEVTSGSAPILHFALELAASATTVQVSAAPESINPASSTTQTMVSRSQIAATPGADRSNSLAMITDFVPGAYLVHDQLHVRGGHQTTWMVDGVAVPNTNIASNVGPQFDPKDIDYLEVQRGGFSAANGDRTYGMFNVVTRSGFERNNQAEVIASYGNYHQTNDQFNFGSHSDRFAYYTSLSANRTDHGLETPTAAVLHDRNSGGSAFSSIIYNATPADQLRMVTSLRGDFYQVPNDLGQDAAGIRDTDHEHDAFANFSWLHTFSPQLLLTGSPFYHFNRVQYLGGPSDTPVIPFDDRSSQYVGGQLELAATTGKHNARAGLYGFGQHDASAFALAATDGSGASLTQQQRLWGNEQAAFIQEQYRATEWLTLTAGLRDTRFSGLIGETALDPRLGAAVQLPRLRWVLRAFYGRTYQPPPLNTVSGPLLSFAVIQGFGFLPLRGERDEQHEFGLTVPLGGWTFDADTFRNSARNFFDHDVLGNSNIFFPLTIARARIHGWEVTLASPRLARRASLHLAFSHQYAEAAGGVSGGLTNFSPPDAGYFFLDHDQRNTLGLVGETELPWRATASLALSYGSGFLKGNGPAHLPAHATTDLALTKSVAENWSLTASALNLTNGRYLLDESNTFGGTHYVEPRQLSLEVRYTFKY